MSYLFIILCCLGITDAIYILYKNRPNKQLFCPLHSDCQAVLKSKWNKFLGVKNEVWGLLYYLSLLAVLWFFLLSIGFSFDIKIIIQLMTGFGMVYSGYLTAVQVFKIKKYCFYCFVSAGVSLLLFVASLFL